MRWVVIICMASVITAVACSKNKAVEPDFPELKKEMAGLWVEIGDCIGCREVSVSLKELTVRHLNENVSETMPFTFFTQDSLYVSIEI